MKDYRPRFDYARFKTRERAELGLEDMFATGDVTESECPLIERKTVSGFTYWAITLPAD